MHIYGYIYIQMIYLALVHISYFSTSQQKNKVEPHDDRDMPSNESLSYRVAKTHRMPEVANHFSQKRQ